MTTLWHLFNFLIFVTFLFNNLHKVYNFPNISKYNMDLRLIPHNYRFNIYAKMQMDIELAFCANTSITGITHIAQQCSGF